MLSMSSQAMRPAMVHSLVDSFFETKKAEVKARLRDQLDRMVDGLFGELVTTVKELLLPPAKLTQDSLAEQVIGSPATSFIVPGTSCKRPRTKASKSSAQSRKQKCESIKRARIGSSIDTLASLKTNADPNKSEKAIDPKVPRKYECQSAGCGQSFDRPCGLKRHEMRVHLGVKPFLCKWPDCTYSSATRDHCIRHIRAIHLKLNAKAPGQQDESPPNKDPIEYVQELT